MQPEMSVYQVKVYLHLVALNARRGSGTSRVSGMIARRRRGALHWAGNSSGEGVRPQPLFHLMPGQMITPDKECGSLSRSSDPRQTIHKIQGEIDHAKRVGPGFFVEACR